MTHAEYLSFLSRSRRVNGLAKTTGELVDVESNLHDEILAYCRQHHCYVVHSRMDRATTNAVGVPDFIVALPGGRTIWIEAKSKKGKLTPAQNGVRIALNSLGHRWACVRNFGEFLEACNELTIQRVG